MPLPPPSLLTEPDLQTGQDGEHDRTDQTQQADQEPKNPILQMVLAVHQKPMNSGGFRGGQSRTCQLLHYKFGIKFGAPINRNFMKGVGW